jgi:hypothetical protein
MAIVINGSGTVTGLSVGGLPDGVVDTDTLANTTVTAAKVAADVATQAELDAAGVGGATGVDFNDNVAVRLGTGNDLKLIHDGTHSKLLNYTGDLHLASDNKIAILGGSDTVETCAEFNDNGAVNLYHDNSKVLNTKTLGVLVSGNIEGYVDNDAHYGATFNSSTGGSGTKYHLSFNRQGTQAGYLTSGPTTVGLNNASDERLKENIQDSASATQDIKNIKVRQFDWKNNRDVHKDYGFVAQELVTVVPEAVAVGSDELNEDGTPVQTWGVDDSKLIPRLVKTIQELEARITALEA